MSSSPITTQSRGDICGTSPQQVSSLRLLQPCTPRDVVKKDLGHFDNLLGNTRQHRVEDLEDTENLRQRCWPAPAGLFLVQLELRLRRECPPKLGGGALSIGTDCWNLCCIFTGTPTTATSATVAAASISFPPWPGGVPRWGGPLGVGGAHRPPVDPRRSRSATNRTHLHPRRTTAGRTEARSAALPPAGPPYAAQEREQGTASALPPTVSPAAVHVPRVAKGVVNEDLGHFNNLLGHRDVQELVDLHQLLSHQRHKNIERRQEGRGVANLFHGVPVYTLLRPHLRERRWQAATRRQAHLQHQVISTQCLPPGSWDAPERGREALLVPTPRPLPSSVSVELSGACTRQGPGRSTAAHAAKQHAPAALSDAGQLLSRAAS